MGGIVINNSRNRAVSPSASYHPHETTGAQMDATYARKRREPESVANAQVSTGGGATGGSGVGEVTTLFTSVFVKDISGVHEAIMTGGASFTIGGPTSGMDIEMVYSTGPAPFEWSAADFTAGRTVVRVILPGYSGVLPFDVGAVDWSWNHSGTGDVMNRITVTKPSGHPVPADYGKFKSRIRVEIQQSA